MRGTRALFLLVVLLTALPSAALAQEDGGGEPRQAPVIVDAASPLEVRVEENKPVSFSFDIINLNTERGFYVTVRPADLEGWRHRVENTGFRLEPEASANVTVNLAPEENVRGITEGTITITLVDTTTGVRDTREFDARITVTDVARVLGIFPNPLPPPLNNEYGVFVLDVLFWIGLGIVVFAVGAPLVRYVTRYARADVTQNILHRLRWPIYLFVFLLGIRDSFGVLPRNPVTVTADRVLSAVAVGVVGAYLAYHVLDAIVYYYTARLASRLRPSVDMVLVPAVRKLLIGVLGTIAFIYVLSVFDVNLGVLFGAAGLAGLVLAFAAQETINNFLGGVFVLVDRPFAEGDDIQLDTDEVVRVESIGLRSTRLYHYRNHELIVVPNTQLASNRIVNLSTPDKRYKLNIEVGVAYGTDVDKARNALLASLDGVAGVTDPADDPPIVLFVEFGDSSLNFILRFGVDDYQDRWTVASDVRERITEVFRREGVEIPFPQRDVWMREARDGEAA